MASTRSSSRGIDEVGLVEQEKIGHGDLLARGLGLLHLLLDLLGIDHRDDRIEPHELLELRDIEEGLRDGPGIGDAGGLDEQIIEAALLEEILHALDQVLAHGAAEAAVVHLHDFLLLVFSTSMPSMPILPTSLTMIGELVAVLLLEDVVEERGFSGAEEAGEDGDRVQASGWKSWAEKRNWRLRTRPKPPEIRRS